MSRRGRKVMVAVGLLLALLIGRSVAVVPVGEETMAPRVQTGDVVLVDRVTYLLRLPYRGEIVISRNEGHLAIDRVVGIGGDTIKAESAQDGFHVLLNGALLGTARTRRADQTPGQWRVPAGFVQVMHDDGRHLRSLSLDDLRGRALFVLYPLDRRGWLL